MKLEDILTLIKAVSDSELTEVKIDMEDEKGDFTFTASKNVKGDGGVGVTAFTSQPVFQQQPAPVPSMPFVSPMPSVPSMPLVPPIPPVPSIPQQQVPSTEVPANGEYITSPMVGTFYAAPSEDAEPFVAIGDTVKKGQVIGIVEAMKLMNEIEATCDGVVEKILVENRSMVGFGDELMFIRTK
ncbi:MAG: acetyl-CoA carboxylase biotin carboxyl carrier protein [Lachnospiraceae bacterium]|nr:acetyl-CoA carboxylase biotin carboxyl carrier protein [Lachnospiraceae bacterium]